MEIAEIKQELDIIEVAAQLGIAVGKDGKALCPFHQDTSPSLQFSREKQICTCFSSKCDVGTMDVISLTEKSLQLTTHEALMHLTKLAGNPAAKAKNGSKGTSKPNYPADFERMQSSFVSSSIARNYAEERKLAVSLKLGYNPITSNHFNYLKGCIVFPLRNAQNQVVSLYGRSVKGKVNGHYYTKDRSGLYPSWPEETTKKLILTESVIDAATLLSVSEIANNYSVLALFGTNGLTAEHVHALQQLNDLQEIILFFDGDEAGKSANEKQGRYLKELFPLLKISLVDTLENEDINSLVQGHDPKVLVQLLNERQRFSFSGEKPEESRQEIAPKAAIRLQTDNPNNLWISTSTAHYYVKGGLRKELDSLKVTLVIQHPETNRKSRNKVDLYDDRQTGKTVREAAEKLGLRPDLVEGDVDLFVDVLDEYREGQLQPAVEEPLAQVAKVGLSDQRKCVEFLSEPNLLSRINKLIGESGVVGEEHNRIFLFCIASSYKMPETLHALIQGSSGSGKTHLLASILNMIPTEDVISLTRVTESSFYNYGEYDLQHKIIGLEDYDGLEEKAELAFRELQSKGMISSSTSMKDEQTGKISAQVKYVYGPIASLSATTKGEVYEDNMSRCFLVAVDESQEQTLRIIKYQNRVSAGHVDKSQSEQIKLFLQNCIRVLKPYEVINPYADQIDLPQEAHKIRRLNSLFQCYVRQITLLNQYQRKKDRKGRLITAKEDIKEAINIMFESIILKVDELDGSLRSFYERLKAHVRKQGESYEFSQREIRQAFRLSKSQVHRYIQQLTELEYISKSYVSKRNTYHYKIGYWDNMQVLRGRIKSDLETQLEKIQ